MDTVMNEAGALINKTRKKLHGIRAGLYFFYGICRAINTPHPDDGKFGSTLLTELFNHLQGQLMDRRSEEHTSELQSRGQLVCRPPLEKKQQRHADENDTRSAWR